MRQVHLAKMQEKMAKLFHEKPSEESVDVAGGDAGSEEETDECDLIAFGGSDEEAETEGSRVAEPYPGDLSSDPSDPPSLL